MAGKIPAGGQVPPPGSGQGRDGGSGSLSGSGTSALYCHVLEMRFHPSWHASCPGGLEFSMAPAYEVPGGGASLLLPEEKLARLQERNVWDR